MSWQKAYIPGSKPDGTPILTILGKRTYTIAPGKTEIADKQIPLYAEDLFENPDSPLYSEVLAETDLLFYKPTTDVIVLGKAKTPKGKQAYHLDCEIFAGPYRKTIRVFGNRRVEQKAIRGIVFSDPEPFAEMPLGYRRAYGGTSLTKEGTITSYYPNPIGKGFTLKGGIEDPQTIQLPNLEDPNSPLTPEFTILSKFDEWVHAPKPCSAGWTRRNFYPRYTYAGILPEFLEAAGKARDEIARTHPSASTMAIPRMDFRVYQGASNGLWGKKFAGNEPVRLVYFDANYPRFDFQLPGDIPGLTIDIGDGVQEVAPNLHTVVIDKENNLLTLTWAGYFPYGGLEQLAQVPKIAFDVFSAHEHAK